MVTGVWSALASFFIRLLASAGPPLKSSSKKGAAFLVIKAFKKLISLRYFEANRAALGADCGESRVESRLKSIVLLLFAPPSTIHFLPSVFIANRAAKGA